MVNIIVSAVHFLKHSVVRVRGDCDSGRRIVKEVREVEVKCKKVRKRETIYD